ncbi:MAG: hypothetical protein JWR81_991 [Pseudonocardia sp.]|jgi:hypothetical protein|nr:hypothetical protein [Pseudonocardia sp.]MDT7618907.1 hypothetical protein [Pseudonocardiales bacterium]
MSRRSVPAVHVQVLGEAARDAGGVAVPVAAAVWGRLSKALEEAARRQSSIPGYAAELRMWSDRYAAAMDGIPTGNVAAPPIGVDGPSPLRRFSRGRLRRPPASDAHIGPDDAAGPPVSPRSSPPPHDGTCTRCSSPV